jgi:hypothetical protein
MIVYHSRVTAWRFVVLPYIILYRGSKPFSPTLIFFIGSHGIWAGNPRYNRVRWFASCNLIATFKVENFAIWHKFKQSRTFSYRDYTHRIFCGKNSVVRLTKSRKKPPPRFAKRGWRPQHANLPVWQVANSGVKTAVCAQSEAPRAQPPRKPKFRSISEFLHSIQECMPVPFVAFRSTEPQKPEVVVEFDQSAAATC